MEIEAQRQPSIGDALEKTQRSLTSRGTDQVFCWRIWDRSTRQEYIQQIGNELSIASMAGKQVCVFYHSMQTNIMYYYVLKIYIIKKPVHKFDPVSELGQKNSYTLSKCYTGEFVLGECVLGECVLGECVLGKCVLGECLLGECVLGEWVLGEWVLGECVLGECVLGE